MDRKKIIPSLVIALVVLLGIFGPINPLLADETVSETGGKDTIADDPGEEGGVSEPFQRWAFFPVVGSSTETGFQFGALAVRFFEPDSPDSRTSTVDFLGYTTTEGQYHLSVSPDIYFDQDRYHFYARVRGEYWPDKFYGIGNETPEENAEDYEATRLGTVLKFERKFWDLVYVGGVYNFETEDIEDDDRGTTITGDVTGADGGIVSGLGYTVSIDRRDNVNDARDGIYALLESVFFDEAIGSDFRYASHNLDLRSYATLTKRTGLAFRGYLRMVRGEIPFQALSTPDGYSMLRGIETGRYRDRDMAALQAELRYPIYWRFGGTLFVETAQVAHELSALRNDGWKVGAGAGLRFALNPSERFNVRLDVSWVDGGVGVTLGVREAF